METERESEVTVHGVQVGNPHCRRFEVGAIGGGTLVQTREEGK